MLFGNQIFVDGTTTIILTDNIQLNENNFEFKVKHNKLLGTIWE